MENQYLGDYDVIGDIHGNVTKLTQLLEKLEYSKSSQGYYQHPTRQVIFLGDFIDGGNEHKQVIDIVKPMVENGSALAIMGNHEFNAISFHTNHPETGLPLRERSIKNIGQHLSFLAEYFKEPKELEKVITWFKTLPLFLDLKEVRAIHACWSDHEINKIKPYLNDDNSIKSTLYDEFFVKANSKGLAEYEAVEILLKGLEVPLPSKQVFFDKSNVPRHEIRVKWWLLNGETFEDYALVPPNVSVPKTPMPKVHLKHYFYDETQKPVFVGHYWFIGTPTIQATNIACLDYSVAKGGNQVAYRWNIGDSCLTNNNFVVS